MSSVCIRGVIRSEANASHLVASYVEVTMRAAPSHLFILIAGKLPVIVLYILFAYQASSPSVLKPDYDIGCSWVNPAYSPAPIGILLALQHQTIGDGGVF